MKQLVKRLLSVVVGYAVFSMCILGVSASTTKETVVDLGDGLYAVETVVDHTLIRSNVKTVSKTWNIKDGGDIIATIELTGTFAYDGNSVSVRSKEVSQCDTYNNWSFSQTSFTSSGGTITLNGKLSRLLKSTSISMSLSCDKNGNVS